MKEDSAIFDIFRPNHTTKRDGLLKANFIQEEDDIFLLEVNDTIVGFSFSSSDSELPFSQHWKCTIRNPSFNFDDAVNLFEQHGGLVQCHWQVDTSTSACIVQNYITNEYFRCLVKIGTEASELSISYDFPRIGENALLRDNPYHNSY